MDIYEVNSKDLKIIAKGGGIGLLGRFLQMSLIVVFQLILARGLGKANIGVLGLGLSVITLAATVVVFGMHRGVVRFVGHYSGIGDKARTAGAIKAALRISLISALVITPLVFISAEFLADRLFNNPDLVPVLRILALSIPFLGLMNILVSVMQGFKRVDYKLFIEQFFVPLLKIVGAIIAIYILGSGLIGVTYAILISLVVGVVLSIFIVWRLYPLRGVSEEKPILNIRSFLRFSWPLTLMTMITRINAESEILVLGALTTSDQVGLYYVGFKAAVLILVFLQAFNIIFAPIIAEVYAKGEQKQLATLYRTITRWAITLSLPFFLILFLFSEDVMAVFGSEFLDGANVLRVLAVSQLIFIMTGPSGLILTMTGYPRLNLMNAILTIIITLALDFWLIPKIGALGAAIAGAISILVVNLLRLIEVYIVLHIQPYDRAVFKPIIAGSVAGMSLIGAGFLLPALSGVFQLIFLGGILVLVYLLILLLLGFEDNDNVIFLAFKRRLVSLSLLPKK